MTTEHPPARAARPEVDPRDPPDALQPADTADEPEPEDLVRDDREEEPRPQASPGS